MKILRSIFVGLALLSGPGFCATLVRLACGGPGGIDPAGTLWTSDAAYSAGGIVYTNTGALPVPFSHLRYAPAAAVGVPFGFAFQFAAPGAYSVTLRFVEPNKTAAGQRIFSVSINGTAALPDLDLFAAAGLLTPKDYSFPVNSPDGAISIVLTPSAWNAVISGIQIDGPALLAPAPIVLPIFDPPFTTTPDIAGLLHIGLPSQTIALTQAPIQGTLDGSTFVVLGSIGATAGRPVPCQSPRFWFSTDNAAASLSYCAGTPGQWFTLIPIPPPQ